MKRLFRSRRPFLGKYVAPAELPPASIDELVDEGVMIAAAGVRLAVKNLMIIKSLRDGLDYDQERYEEAVREELLNLADEKDGDAARIAGTREAASRRSGRPERHNDYRSVDSDALRRREDVSRALASRLREVSEDDAWAAGLVRDARASALDEIAASVRASLIGTSILVDEEYERERPKRLRLLSEDLFELQTTPRD
ncbi:hypothetical protein [Schumannella luteola]|jgi:hypothetical protein